MLDFLNQKLWTSFKEDDLMALKDFVLLWNVFEDTLFNKSFSVTKASEFIWSNSLNIELFEKHLSYFRDRYVLNWVFTDKYQLFFRTSDREDIVKKVLLWETSNSDELILGMLLIIFRYRNNLFHWLKEFWKLDKQKENFEIANDFLKTLIDYIP